MRHSLIAKFGPIWAVEYTVSYMEKWPRECPWGSDFKICWTLGLKYDRGCHLGVCALHQHTIAPGLKYWRPEDLIPRQLFRTVLSSMSNSKSKNISTVLPRLPGKPSCSIVKTIVQAWYPRGSCVKPPFHQTFRVAVPARHQARAPRQLFSRLWKYCKHARKIHGSNSEP